MFNGHSGFNSPCKGCEKRHRACWDTCEEYQKGRKEWESLREEHKSDMELNSYVVKISQRAIERERKRRR